jgi:hypothetical protein
VNQHSPDDGSAHADDPCNAERLPAGHGSASVRQRNNSPATWTVASETSQSIDSCPWNIKFEEFSSLSPLSGTDPPARPSPRDRQAFLLLDF